MQELIDALIFVCSMWILLCCLWLVHVILVTFIPQDTSSSIETTEKEKDNSSFLKIT